MQIQIDDLDFAACLAPCYPVIVCSDCPFGEQGKDLYGEL